MEVNLLSLLLIILLPILLLIFLSFIVRPKPTKIPLKNRHVFITGGSSGIGLALAHQAAFEGANVSILARNSKKLEEAKDSIKLATGRDINIFSADVRDYEDVVKAVNNAGPIDVLVCNQGVFVPQELEMQPLEEVKFMIDVNVMGTFHLIKAALPGMKNRSGRGPGSIAIMSSQAGQAFCCLGCNRKSLEMIFMFLLYFPPTLRLLVLQKCCFCWTCYQVLSHITENKRRPQLTTIIAASSGAMKAEDVAKKTLRDILSGNFMVPCNFEGLLLSIGTAGLSPQRSLVMAFIEVVAAGIVRIGALCFQWNWYTNIEKWQACKK